MLYEVITEKEAIFEPFRRVENKLVDIASGAGLGLAIVKKLVHILDGVRNNFV